MSAATEPPTPPRTFVVLSLDGGGVRGILTANILARIERYLNERLGGDLPLGHRVDLIAGTSTGGIIGLGLGAGKPAAEIATWYERRIPGIFQLPWWRKWARALRGPRHRTHLLRESIEEFFGDRTLETTVADLCVVSVALETAMPRIYKTGHLKRNGPRLAERMADVAMATSAAPNYFEAATPPVGGGPLIDGGLCANNPVLIAYTDAMQFERERTLRGREVPATRAERHGRVLVLSVGTGRRGVMPYKAKKLVRGGAGRWLLPALEIYAEAQSLTADAQASFLLEDAYHRINPSIGAGFELDDPRAIEGLKAYSDLTAADAAFLERNLGAFAAGT
jgi:hypothetical protein